MSMFAHILISNFEEIRFNYFVSSLCGNKLWPTTAAAAADKKLDSWVNKEEEL